MWISGGRNRAIARLAFSDQLPSLILNRRSKGTFISYSGAVYRKTKDQMREFLLNDRLQARGLLNADALRSYLDSTLPARDTSFTRVFDLCMIENWVRHQY